MEGFLVLCVIGVVIYFIVRAKSQSTRTTSHRTAFHGIPFAIRLNYIHLESEDAKVPAIEVQARGLFPIREEKSLAAWISIFDGSDGENKPVVCQISHFQEIDTPAYFMACELGLVAPHYGIPEWVRIGMIFPEILWPPIGGQRELTAVVRLVDLSDPPILGLGFIHSNGSSIIWSQKATFAHYFDEKGYQEAAEHREEAQVLTLRIAMAVAMSDGSLDEQEGLLMKKWIKRSITPFSGEDEARMKNIFNQTLQRSYSDARHNSLDLLALAGRLKDIGETSSKYNALELGADIMAADGIVHADEIKALNSLAELLDLDLKRVKEILDTRFVKLDLTDNEGASAEDLIGISPNWPKDRVNKQLLVEFSKWNGLLNTLPEGKERDNAQHMLDLIASLREKYVR